MFADNTTIILRNQAEADTTIEILDIYVKATGAKINLEKSYLLKVGRVPNITIEGI